MMLSSPTRDFLVKAAMFAKENRYSEFNQLETELIILEETLIRIKESVSPSIYESYNEKIPLCGGITIVSNGENTITKFSNDSIFFLFSLLIDFSLFNAAR